MNRYSRNILTIGSEGQKRLSEASVFIIGCGALGGQVAMLLAGAGIGRIGIADFDTIDITNLQRQLFFTESEAGERKLDILATRMAALNSEIGIEKYPELIRRQNAVKILTNYDFVVDATDNYVAKFEIDAVCNELGIPHCTGGVSGWRGQVMSIDPRGVGDKNNSEESIPDCKQNNFVSFGDVFTAPENDPEMLPCNVDGVIGAAASAIASIQAAEVIKYFTGEGEMLFGRLMVMDLKRGFFNTVDL